MDVRKKWAIILLILSILIVSNIGVVQFYINTQQEDAKAINTAGRQRMLLQSMMTETERIQNGDVERRDELAQAASLYDESLTQMKESSNGLPDPNPTQTQQIQSISNQWSDFKENVTILLTADPQSPQFLEAYQSIRDTKPSLQEQTDQLVIDYQQASERKLRILQASIIGLAILVLLVIFGIWFVISESIIRPLEKLKEDTEAVAKGDVEYNLNEPERNDELGTTTQSVQELKSQLEDALTEARGFRAAVEQAGHPIYITSTDGTITYVNPEFEAATGYSAEEAIGNNPNILLSEERPDSFYDELWDQILGGEIWEGEMVNRTKGGERYVVHQTIAPIKDESGEISSFVAVNTEITDQKRRQQIIEILNRVLRHNIRNRMNVILGRDELIRNVRLDGLRDAVSTPESENSDSKKSVKRGTNTSADSVSTTTIRNQIESITDEIESDATAIRDSGGEIVPTSEKAREVTQMFDTQAGNPEYMIFRPAVNQEIQRIQEDFPDKQITIEFERSVSVKLNQYLMTGVLEVIRNAVNQSDTPVRVEITVTESRDEVIEISVADNGPGIPEQELEVLQKGEETPLEHGSGLGLWVVNWAAEWAGGQLEIEDNQPTGAVVRIRIPTTANAIRLLSSGEEVAATE